MIAHPARVSQPVVVDGVTLDDPRGASNRPVFFRGCSRDRLYRAVSPLVTKAGFPLP